VTFAGWLMKLRAGSGESCNCGSTNGGGKEVTDMHLVVISSSARENAPECKSVTRRNFSPTSGLISGTLTTF
jgi:hypothetical protein